jgi:hypothetical protein
MGRGGAGLRGMAAQSDKPADTAGPSGHSALPEPPLLPALCLPAGLLFCRPGTPPIAQGILQGVFKAFQFQF